MIKAFEIVTNSYYLNDLNINDYNLFTRSNNEFRILSCLFIWVVLSSGLVTIFMNIRKKEI